MKKERMAVISLLEKGIISADEAERLLKALNEAEKSGSEKKESFKVDLNNVSSDVGEALGKLGFVIKSTAKTAGEATGKFIDDVRPVILKTGKKVKNFYKDKKYGDVNQKVKDSNECWCTDDDVSKVDGKIIDISAINKKEE